MTPKQCKVCSSQYDARNSLQVVCSVNCAIEHAKIKNDKRKAKESRLSAKELKLKVRTKHWYIKKTRTAFNNFIRERDAAQACISCGSIDSYQWHSGHYRSTAAAPHLQFNEDNAHKQCIRCNTHLSGNLIPYRKNLIEKIGEARVLSIEENNKIKNFLIEELLQLEAEFKRKFKELKHAKN